MLKTALWFRVRQSVVSLLIFYAIIIFQLLLVSGGAILSGYVEIGGASANGIDFASVIFIFVLGLNSFKDSFFMFMQNGLSRKTLFWSYLGSLAPICGFMAVLDNALGMLGLKLGTFEMMYTMYENHFTHTLPYFLVGILWSFCLYAAFALAGYMITTFYYRAGKELKISVSVGAPIFLFVALPLIDSRLTDGSIINFLHKAFLVITGIKAGYNPFYPILFNLLFSLVFAGFCYLLARRSVIKEPN